MEQVTTLKPNVVKSLIKGTVAIAVITPFLQISRAHFDNFIIFLVICYVAIGGYMLNKGAAWYKLEDQGIRYKRLLGAVRTLPYDNIADLGFSQGLLAKRFGCGTVYVELKSGKGTFKSPEGRGVFIMKDVLDPRGVCKEIEDSMNPFAAADVDLPEGALGPREPEKRPGA